MSGLSFARSEGLGQLAKAKARQAKYEALWPERVKAAKAAYKARWPARRAATLKAWNSRWPEKRRAAVAVNNAIRDGRMQRQPCTICGERAQAHHEDYARPLHVVWLCVKHHQDAHARGRHNG